MIKTVLTQAVCVDSCVWFISIATQVTGLSATLLYNPASSPAGSSSQHTDASDLPRNDSSPLGVAVVWVTDMREGRGMPVMGATVQMFLHWSEVNRTPTGEGFSGTAMLCVWSASPYGVCRFLCEWQDNQLSFDSLSDVQQVSALSD